MEDVLDLEGLEGLERFGDFEVPGWLEIWDLEAKELLGGWPVEDESPLGFEAKVELEELLEADWLAVLDFLVSCETSVLEFVNFDSVNLWTSLPGSFLQALMEVTPVALPVAFPVSLPVSFPVLLPVALPMVLPVLLPVAFPVVFPAATTCSRKLPRICPTSWATSSWCVESCCWGGCWLSDWWVSFCSLVIGEPAGIEK